MNTFTLKGFIAGSVQTFAIGVYGTNQYGSLEGYIKHLQSPDCVWWQIPIWIPTAVAIAAGLYYATVFVKEQDI